MAAKGFVQCDGQRVDINIVHPALPLPPVDGPIEKDKLLICNLPPNTMERDLLEYLSQVRGSIVKSIQARRGHLALIEFDEIPGRSG